jgi:hypothetical protein
MSKRFIVNMSTEMFCETQVAGGATVTPLFRFTLNLTTLASLVRWAALLLKLWLCGGLRGFGMCAAGLANFPRYT